MLRLIAAISKRLRPVPKNKLIYGYFSRVSLGFKKTPLKATPPGNSYLE